MLCNAMTRTDIVMQSVQHHVSTLWRTQGLLLIQLGCLQHISPDPRPPIICPSPPTVPGHLSEKETTMEMNWQKLITMTSVSTERANATLMSTHSRATTTR